MKTIVLTLIAMISALILIEVVTSTDELVRAEVKCVCGSNVKVFTEEGYDLELSAENITFVRPGDWVMIRVVQGGIFKAIVLSREIVIVEPKSNQNEKRDYSAHQ